MKKVFLLLMVSITFGCSHNTDTESILVDRVWRTNDNTQYYFSSKYKKQFIWISEVYTGKFRPAYGAPDTQKFNPNDEGWLSLGRFKIEGDTLFVQRESDTDGKEVRSIYLKPGKDSLIGIIDYQTMTAYIPDGWKWVSENTKD